MTDSPFAGIEPPSGVDYGSFTFSVKQFVLLNLAESVVHAVPSREGIPVLTSFRVTVSEAGLEVVATDGEQAAFAVTPGVACEEKQEQVFHIAARKLLGSLREAPAGDVTVTVKKNQAAIVAGNVNWNVKLPDSAGFPKLPDLTEVKKESYDRAALLTALRAVRHAICKDAGQPSLTQVSVTGKGSECVVTASDRSRLARWLLPGFPFEVTIPSGVLDDLQRLLSGHPADTISVGETVSHLVFEVGNVTLAVARRTISFPDVEKQLLAGALKDNSALLTVDCAELAKAVKRVRINADAQTSAIALRLSSGRLLVESRDKAGNSAEESVLASWEGKERVLVVNHGFLSEMLAAHGESLCEFRLGPDVGKRLSVLLLPGQPGCVQVLTRMPAVLLGY